LVSALLLFHPILMILTSSSIHAGTRQAGQEPPHLEKAGTFLMDAPLSEVGDAADTAACASDGRSTKPPASEADVIIPR
jgi:hypothetical protein